MKLFRIKDAISFIKSKKVLLKILSSSFLSLPVSIAISFLTYRMIDPYFMGIWATMTVFETYAGVLRLGVINGMNRELPHAMGEGKKDEAIKYAQTALAYNLFATFILWLIVPFLITNFEFNNTYLICIGVNLIRVSLSFYTTYISGTFRTTDNFNKLSNIQFVMIGVHLLLSPLIYFFKFDGYLIMQLFMVIINALLLHKYRPFHIKPNFNFNSFIKLIKIGIPLFISSYIVGFIDTLPRLFIIKFGDETMLGLFSPILLVISTLSLLPNTLGTYYYPKFSYQYGKTGDAKNMLNTLMKIFGGSFLLLIPFVIGGYFLIDELDKVFPKYAGSIPYLKISLFIAPFTLAKLGNYISVVLKKVDFLTYHVVFYAVYQISTLAILYIFYTKDVLMVSVLSIVFTYILLFFTSIILNYKLVRSTSLKLRIR